MPLILKRASTSRPSGQWSDSDFDVPTASYFENQDLFAQWLEEKCDVEPDNPHKTTTSADLFKSWSDYAKGAGDTAGIRKSFARILERHRFKPDRAHGGTRIWRGIHLKVPTGYSMEKQDG